jgi:hypothetical protein
VLRKEICKSIDSYLSLDLQAENRICGKSETVQVVTGNG